MKKYIPLLSLILSFLCFTVHSANNIIKIKSKPVFEFRQDYSQTLSDSKGNSGFSPLNIWLVVKNHKASYSIKVGQAWPKPRAILDKTKFDESKHYTFIIKATKTDNLDNYELLTVYDKEVLIYENKQLLNTDRF